MPERAEGSGKTWENVTFWKNWKEEGKTKKKKKGGSTSGNNNNNNNNNSSSRGHFQFHATKLRSRECQGMAFIMSCHVMSRTQAQ